MRGQLNKLIFATIQKRIKLALSMAQTNDVLVIIGAPQIQHR